jgi:hypothetical protein
VTSSPVWRPAGGGFALYLVAFFGAWTACVLWLYALVAGPGEGSFAEAAAGIGVRLLIRLAPLRALGPLVGVALAILLFIASVAILPDAETSAQIHRMAAVMKAAHTFRGQLTAPDRLHVTLFSLGGLPEQLVEKACEAMGEVRAEPFEISFDPP